MQYQALKLLMQVPDLEHWHVLVRNTNMLLTNVLQMLVSLSLTEY